MKQKGSKVIWIVLVLFLASTLLAAGGTSTTQSISFGENTHVSLGKAGLVFSGSQYDGTVTLTRVNKGNLPGIRSWNSPSICSTPAWSTRGRAEDHQPCWTGLWRLSEIRRS